MQNVSDSVRMVDAFDDPQQVWEIITRGGPYRLMMSLAGYDMGSVDHAAMPWFREYWAREKEVIEPGASAVFHSTRFLDVARELTGTQHIVASQMLLNLMGPMPTGAAHIDTPTFRTGEVIPLWLRLSMGASGLFDRWWIHTCGAVSWFYYDGPGGEYEYWPDGPTRPSRAERPPFDNVAVFADNDRMFHRVGAIGAPDDRLPEGSLSSAATLSCADDGRWEIRDGRSVMTLDSTNLRVSTLWTALCFDTSDELLLYWDHSDDLTLARVTEIFIEDLDAKGIAFEKPADPATDPAWVMTLNQVYPLATVNPD
jgi:hypothetical protein